MIDDGEMGDVAARIAHHNLLLNSTAEPARQYLVSRGVTRDTIAKWKIGWWDDTVLTLLAKYPQFQPEPQGLSRRLLGRITVPLTFPNGTIRHVTGRALALDANIRWLYPPKDNTQINMRAQLLGFEHLDWDTSPRVLAAVEGPLDAVLWQQIGIPSVCIHGTSFTLEQALIMASWAEQLLLCPDGGDASALRNITKSYEMHKRVLPETRIIRLPTGKDPANLSSDPDLVKDLLSLTANPR